MGFRVRARDRSSASTHRGLISPSGRVESLVRRRLEWLAPNGPAGPQVLADLGQPAKPADAFAVAQADQDLVEPGGKRRRESADDVLVDDDLCTTGNRFERALDVGDGERASASLEHQSPRWVARDDR